MKNVLHVPQFDYSLLPVSALVSKGFCVSFTFSGTRILLKISLIAVSTLKNKLNYVNTRRPSNTALVMDETWHERLGHVEYRTISAMSDGTVRDLRLQNKNLDTQPGRNCIAGKMIRSDIPKDFTMNR